jgi:hypothetical protein
MLAHSFQNNNVDKGFSATFEMDVAKVRAHDALEFTINA